MKILAMDSSGLVASVAIVEDGRTTAEYTVNYKKTHSQTLLPMLDAIAQMVELDLNTVDAFAVAAGPGSFTGLRIGSATVKGLGLALDKPVIPVPTMEGIAYNGWGYKGVICPMMDARRGQVFTGLYRSHTDKPGLEVLMDQTSMDVGELITYINEQEFDRVLLLGDGADAFHDRLAAELKVPFDFAPAHMNAQRAAAVGTLASYFYDMGRAVSAADHKPDYLKVSQAERVRKESENR